MGESERRARQRERKVTVLQYQQVFVAPGAGHAPPLAKAKWYWGMKGAGPPRGGRGGSCNWVMSAIACQSEKCCSLSSIHSSTHLCRVLQIERTGQQCAGAHFICGCRPSS